MGALGTGWGSQRSSKWLAGRWFSSKWLSTQCACMPWYPGCQMAPWHLIRAFPCSREKCSWEGWQMVCEDLSGTVLVFWEWGPHCRSNVWSFAGINQHNSTEVNGVVLIYTSWIYTIKNHSFALSLLHFSPLLGLETKSIKLIWSLQQHNFHRVFAWRG